MLAFYVQHRSQAVVTDTNGVTRYEVECIMAQRGTGARREMLVHWKGYGTEHDEWRSRSDLTRSAPKAVAEYDAMQQGGSTHAARSALRQLLASMDRPSVAA